MKSSIRTKFNFLYLYRRLQELLLCLKAMLLFYNSLKLVRNDPCALYYVTLVLFFVCP